MSSLAAALLIFAVPLAAGRDVTGRVLDAPGGRPLAGALAVAKTAAGEAAARTDAQGRFRLNVAASAVLRFVVSLEGYAEAVIGPPLGEDILIRLTPDPSAFLPSKEVFVEASGLDRPGFELPYAGRTLARERVVEGGAEGLNDAVADVPGLSFLGGGFYSAPALRGLARNRLVLLVDGVRTASIRTIGGHLGFIHPYFVEAVEVLKGPFSTVYGHDAMAGVLQVDALRPRVPGNGFALRGGAAAGSSTGSGGGNAAFHLDGGTRNASFLVAYGRTDEGDYRMGGGGALPRSGFGLASFLARGEIRPADGHRIDVFYLHTGGRDIGKASGDPTLINVHPREINDIGALAYEWRPHGRLLSSLEARLSRGSFSLASDFRTVTGPRTVQSLRDMGEDDFGLVLKAGLTPAAGALVFVGVDGFFQENQVITGTKSVYLEERTEPVSVSPLDEVPPAANRDVGLFAQGTWAAAPKWDVVFGARVDFPSERVERETGVESRRFDAELNGNLGLLFKISPELRLGANVGTAFRQPTPKDRYFVGQTPQGMNIGDPGLKPEHSLNFDLVLKGRTGTAGPLRAEGSLAAFVNRLRDLIVIRWDKPVGDRTGTFANAGRTEIYGLEADASLAWDSGWSLRAALTALTADVHGSDEVLDDLPPLQAVLGLRRSLGGGAAWLGIDLKGAAAERRTSSGDEPAPAWLTVDAAAGWRLARGLTLRWSLDNLFDASYREFFDLAPIRRPGRRLAVSVAAEL